MEDFMNWLKGVNDVVWGPGMLVLLVGTGLYLTVGLKFFTFRNFFRGLKNLWAGRNNQSEQGEISPFNALMTALAADIGTGNIVGVSTAIYVGGPGALFWMWITALVGMATKFSEVLLSVHFREKTPAGNWVGGAMYFIKNGLGPKWMWLGSCFALRTSQLFNTPNMSASAYRAHVDAEKCVACGKCAGLGRCVFDDLVNELAPKLEACDGLVVGSPVYYASANATLVALLTRLFYSTPFDKTMKVGAAVAAARRGGLSSTFDELNKFFTISGMPVASSQYWNSIHGRLPGEAAQDAEGLQTMRTLARNMAFLVKSIALGREKYGLPEREEPLRTHFIR